MGPVCSCYLGGSPSWSKPWWTDQRRGVWHSSQVCVETWLFRPLEYGFIYILVPNFIFCYMWEREKQPSYISSSTKSKFYKVDKCYVGVCKCLRSAACILSCLSQYQRSWQGSLWLEWMILKKIVIWTKRKRNLIFLFRCNFGIMFTFCCILTNILLIFK